MNKKGRTILLCHFILVGFVLMSISWKEIMAFYPLNTVVFFFGAVLMIGGLFDLIINMRKKPVTRNL